MQANKLQIDIDVFFKTIFLSWIVLTFVHMAKMHNYFKYENVSR